MKSQGLVWLYCLLVSANVAAARTPGYFFRQVTVADGLNDGVVNAIAQDKFGYMWFATMGGINRYDGYTTRVFSYRQNDSTSPYPGVVESICTDLNGNLFFGYRGGLLQFNYNDRFERIRALEGLVVFDMMPVSPEKIFMATSRGLASYNPVSRSAFFYSAQKDTSRSKYFSRGIGSLARQGDNLYFQGPGGIIEMNISSEKTTLIPVPEIKNSFIPSLAVSNEGNIFIVTYNDVQLMMINAGSKSRYNYNEVVGKMAGVPSANVSHVFKDAQNRIWATTAVNGLLEYEPATNSFYKHVHDTRTSRSISSNLTRCIFQDGKGVIWVGNGRGLNYFDPSGTMFSTVMPFADSLDVRSRRLARGFAEDTAGNYWFTSGDGCSRYNPVTGQYTEWNNKPGKTPAVYFNSIRGIATDKNNDVWIATGAGINRFNAATQQMDFIDGRQLPAAFYFSANTDRQGRVWFGTRDFDGFYWYDPVTKTFHSIKEIAPLQPFAGMGGRYVFQDSKGRMWFGFNGNGAGMYDAVNKRTYQWSPYDSLNSLAGGMVIDIKEDRKGMIWISTASGITGIDVEHNRLQSFNSSNGLPSNTASALVIDEKNRLWIATGRGLCMLDSRRKRFITFTANDGLPANEFPEHPAVQLRNGESVIPSIEGYVFFNPLHYKEDTARLSCYITSYNIADAEHFLPEDPQATGRLDFGTGENFFTLKMLAINYSNISQTWYAYKLDGIDKQWHYSQDRKAVYTNVPGGSYVFRFKASADPGNWNVEEHTMAVNVATIFYKSAWFRLMVAMAAAFLIYAFYRYRIAQQQQVYNLQNKAQLLEQEKTRIMYENLKQQLNPHFLFNSLTSLSGLIETDQQLATSFLEQMSKIYRYILKNSSSELVSLKEEINFVKIYITLQQTRFKNGLQVIIDAAEAFPDHRIAPVTLQNMVENAIKHNIIDADSPLLISITVAGGYVVVKNNLQPKSVVETSNKQGLASLQNLYRFLTPEPVIIQQDEHYFSIHIPLIK